MSKPSKTHAVSADGRGIARQWDETLAEAAGVIGQYCQDGDVNRLQFEHTVESLVEAKVTAKGGSPDKWEDRIKAVLKGRATDDDTIYPFVQKATRNDPTRKWTVPQGVALDVGGNSLAEELNRDWGLPVPYIHFCELKPGDSFYKKGVAECAAIAFDPAYMDPDQARTIVWDGQPVTVASDWDPAGYVGIVRVFSSYRVMKQERKALISALAAIHTDLTASDEEPDEFADNSWLDDADEAHLYESDESL